MAACRCNQKSYCLEHVESGVLAEISAAKSAKVLDAIDAKHIRPMADWNPSRAKTLRGRIAERKEELAKPYTDGKKRYTANQVQEIGTKKTAERQAKMQHESRNRKGRQSAGYTPPKGPATPKPARFAKQKKNKNEVTPPPIVVNDQQPTLHALRISQCIELLQGSSRKEHKTQGARTREKYLRSQMSDFDVIEDLKADRHVSRYLFECAGLRTFNISRISTISGMKWIARIGFLGMIRKIDQQYRLHLVLDPTEHFDKLDEIDTEQAILDKNPTLLGEFNDEDVKKIKDKREAAEKEFKELQLHCPDIILELEVKESKYTDAGWTIIAFKISAESVNLLNDRRDFLKHYKVLLSPIEQ